MAADADAPDLLPLFLTDDDVRMLSDVDRAIDALRAAYTAEADHRRTPGRLFADSSREWMRIMPSVPASGDLFGAKSINGSFADGLRVSYLISLFSKASAGLVALVDGNRVTGLRTAATTAVGAQAITGSGPLRVGVIGSGFEARSHLDALERVLRIDDVRIFSPTPANREAFAAEVDGRAGAAARAVDSARDAVEGADLVLCAARSRDESPTIAAEWVADDATVLSIGSTTPAQRELPADLIARARVVVADTVEEVVHGSGDLLAAAAAGVDVDALVVPLADAIALRHPIDTARGIRIYKSTGSGLQDIVVAEMLYRLARERGIGTTLPVGIVTTRK
jgi:alanine dehydrogenase